MAGSGFGTIFHISTWGESHGKALGVVIDGCPAGLSLEEADIQKWLDRRRPGQSAFTTKRSESDTCQILSGVFEGKTTGTPISIVVYNEDQRSRDYSQIADIYRPGHADFTFDAKYGFRDYRGGGRSSGRETIGRVAAGAVAMKLLETLGVDIFAYAQEIGGVAVLPENFVREEIYRNPLAMPDKEAAAKAEVVLNHCIEEKDSAGGIISCIIRHVPKGLGEPVFEKLDANLAKAMMSIGAVKGIEIGDGFAVAKATGKTNNDNFIDGSNHAGGILGGISNGEDILLRVAVKPTPSIVAPQRTINKEGNPVSIEIKGRHDPVIVPRAVVVVEAMAALTVADMLLVGMGAKLSDVQKRYES